MTNQITTITDKQNDKQFEDAPKFLVTLETKTHIVEYVFIDQQRAEEWFDEVSIFGDKQLRMSLKLLIDNKIVKEFGKTNQDRVKG